MKRARKHADAVVVPTHALAERLAHGRRLRRPGARHRHGTAPGPEAAAPTPPLACSSSACRSDYLVTVGTLEPRNGVVDLLEALGRPGVPDIPLVVHRPRHAGASSTSPRSPKRRASRRTGSRRSRRATPPTSRPCSRGATAFVAPSHEEGSGTSLIEAFSLGVPVIHSDTPAYVEVSGDAGMSVPVGTRRLRRPARRCRHDGGRGQRTRRAPVGRRARPRPRVQLARLRRAGLAAARRPLTPRSRRAAPCRVRPGSIAPVALGRRRRGNSACR